jgi:hypothetical protein
MPAPVTPAVKQNPPLLAILFWIGVALAPVAALILLVADGNGPLRFAAVLAILAVVLIGLSIALRADGGGPADTEELLDEIEQLRRELRGEIVAAAQRGNQAIDQAQRAQEGVVALRRRLDAAVAAPPAEEPAGAGRARVTPVEEHDDLPAGRGWPTGQDEAASGWGRATVDRDGEDDAGRRPQPSGRYGPERPAPAPSGVYGAAPRPAEYGSQSAFRPAEQESRAAFRTAEQDNREAFRPGEQEGRAAVPGPEHAPRPVGLVRHTETVHVTTRHTIVDGGAPDPAAGNHYGGGYAGRWSPAAGPEERPWGGHGQEPEGRSRAGYAEPDERDYPNPPEDRSWAGSAAPRDDRSWAAGQGGQRDDSAWADQRDDRSWPGPAAPRDDRSWADGRGGQQDDRFLAGQQDDRSPAGQRDERGWGAPAEPAWGVSGEQRGRSYPTDGADPEDGDYWSELRTGNRWAEVRDDERGREVRVGERREAVHADGSGYRVEDRWAAVRRREPDREEPRREYGRDGGDEWGGGRAEESRPALPAGGVPVPGEWRPPIQRGRESVDEWRTAEPEPEPRSRHQRAGEDRYGYPPRDDVPRAGAARSAEHWR